MNRRLSHILEAESESFAALVGTLGKGIALFERFQHYFLDDLGLCLQYGFCGLAEAVIFCHAGLVCTGSGYRLDFAVADIGQFF